MQYFVSFVLLSVLAALLWTPDSGDAFRLRRHVRIRVRRIRVRRIIEPICTIYCTRQCTLPGPICAPACRKICSIGRKRREANACLEAGDPFPGDFDAYDADGDLQISVEEFARTIRTRTVDEARDAFAIADRDGDGMIAESEFEAAPFCFDTATPVQNNQNEIEEEHH